MTFNCKLFLPFDIKLWWRPSGNDENKTKNIQPPNVFKPKLKRRWLQTTVRKRDQWGPNIQLIQCRGFTGLPPSDWPQPRNCRGLMESWATLPPTLTSSLLLLCRSMKYCFMTRLSGHSRGSSAQTDQSGGSPFLLPGLDAHLCIFDTSTAGETKQSWWLLSTWILLS